MSRPEQLEIVTICDLAWPGDDVPPGGDKFAIDEQQNIYIRPDFVPDGRVARAARIAGRTIYTDHGAFMDIRVVYRFYGIELDEDDAVDAIAYYARLEEHFRQIAAEPGAN
jgi:hypothetical protein